MEKIIKLHFCFRDIIVRYGEKIGEKHYIIDVSALPLDLSFWGIKGSLKFIEVNDLAVTLFLANGMGCNLPLVSEVLASDFEDSYDFLDYLGETLVEYLDGE